MTQQTPAHLVELLRHLALTNPDGHAYSWLVDSDDEELKITYSQVDAQSRAIAAMLQDMGAKGQRALLLYPPGLEYIGAYFGCIYSGVIAVPAYPPRLNMSATRLGAIVADAQATVALTTSGIFQKLQLRLPKMPQLAALQWETTDRMGTANASAWKPFEPSKDTVAFLQYTSGTTAIPRGVMVTHGNLLANSALITEGFSQTAGDRGIFWLPIYHDMGLIGGLLQPLWHGHPTTLMPPAAFLLSPYRWLRAISRLKATISGGPNMAYDLCTRQVTAEQRATLDLSSWKLAFTGAEPIRAETLRRFVAAFEPCGFSASSFYPCYGSAEGTLIITGGQRQVAPRVRRLDRKLLSMGRAVDVPPDASGAEYVSCGHSLGKQMIKVVDPESLQECAQNVVGEVWVQGESVASGYWNNPDETGHTFGGCIQPGGEAPFLRNRDLGFMDGDEFFFVSRLPDVLRVQGRNHYPHDVEATAEGAHQSLRAGFGAAFTIEDGKVVLVFELERRAKPDMESIILAVRQALHRDHELELHAFALIRILSIPKTTSGKIQRYATRDAFLSSSLDVRAEWTAEGGLKLMQ